MKKFLPLLFVFISSFNFSQTWQTVGGNVISNDIHGFAIWNSQLAIGGSFNGNPCDKVVLFDSTNWICPAGGIGSVVRAVTSYNGNLVAIGDFWNVNQPCTNCNGVAVWNGTNWSNLGTGFNNDVLCMTVWNGNLVVGGDFTTADGNPCYRVAMWNGTNWAPVGGLDTVFNNDVRALAVYNGELWAGGDFTNANGCTACDRIVKWNGTAWVGGNSGVDIAGGLDSTVRVLYVDPVANRLYMGGHFLEVGGDVNCSGVAFYDGSVWSAMGTGVNSYVRGITRYNGNIIVGGDFTTAGGGAALRVAKWSPTTNLWSAMNIGMTAYLRALIEYKGELYAGGSFHNAGGQTIDYIAKWYETPTAPPTANFSVSDNTICLGQCVSFTDMSTGTPTSWNWTFGVGASPANSTSQNPATVCYPTGGTKTVTLQACNSNGCTTYTTSITVSASPPPSVTLNGVATICAGASTTLSASGATTYSWSPSSGLSATTGSTVTATPATTTNYTVTGTSTGCTDVDSVLVTVNPLPVVSVSPASVSICPSTSATLSASGAGTYTWSPGGGLSATNTATVSANPSVTTTYTVTGTSSGCSATASVTVNAGAAASLPLVEGFQTLPYLPAGWSMLDGAADNNTWLHNTSVGGFGTSSSCSWFPNNSVNAPGTKDEMQTMRLNFLALTSAQLYFDVAYCRKNNASFSDTLVVYASTDCGQNWIEIYSKGGSTLATAANQNGSFVPLSNQWRTDTISLNSYIGQANVSFAFQNRNYNGNNLYIDNINISGINNNPPAADFVLSSDTICSGQCLSFTDNSAGFPTSWSWSFAGSGTPSSALQNPGSVCWTTAGSHIIQLAACNANGCDTLMKTIYVSLPTADAGVNDSICSGENSILNGSGSGSYSWSPSVSLSCVTCANPVASPTATTIYTLTVTDGNGCQNNASVNITVDACLGLQHSLAANELVISPNPSSGIFYLQSKTIFTSVEILNILGEKITERNGRFSEIMLDLGSYPAGIYFACVKLNDKNIFLRIVLSR
jgi:PKD repeat protein